MVDVKQIKHDLNFYFKINGWYQIDPNTGHVEVDGDVFVSYRMAALPVQFSTVHGNFDCIHVGLLTLKGAPVHVTGNFNCRYNYFRDLLYAPLKVDGDFNCSDNQLKSLQGAPTQVGGSFDCRTNHITELAHAPNYVGGHFYCNDNPLTNLVGLPDHVEGQLLLSYSRNLPLLRVFMYKNVNFASIPKPLESIILKYAGAGRSGALLAAAELIRTGYPENARW